MGSTALMSLVSLLVLTSATADAYKILVVTAMPSKSHATLGRGFVRPLLNAGHEVIFASPYPGKPMKNLRLIELPDILKTTSQPVNLLGAKDSNSISFIKEFAFNVSKSAITCPEMQKLLKTEKIDAVITEWFFTELDAGIAAVLQCPRIVLNGMTMHSGLEYLVDSVQSPAIIPMLLNDFPVPMSFFERVANTFFVALMTLSAHFIDLPATEVHYKEIFTPIAKARGVELPPFFETIHDISVMFVNSHPSMGYAQSLPPNAIEVGGYHIDPKIEPLPEDLKSILDNSPNGVIYFSMGSVLRSADMPQEIKQGLLNIFKDLPYTVLWKFEEKLENTPKNVIIKPWMPQPSILNHPNVKLFITHGGLLSGLEAMHYGVPILAVPVFGDQPSNAARAVRKGYALAVPYSYTSEMLPELKEKLLEMLSNDKYYNKAKEISYLFRSRPMSNEDIILHYIKLAIESKGALHLRSKSLLYPWYQRLLLDQLAVLLIIVSSIYFLIKKVCCSSRKTEKSKIKKN